MMKFFGGLLMAIGILIATLSGLCSLFFLISMNDGGALPLVLIVGGLPCASGVGLFYWGRSLVRRARERGE